MKNTLQTRLGIFFALAFVAAVVILETIGGLEFLKRGKVIAARFTNVLELNVGDPVKMAGKQIGRVDSIEFADDKVRVTMKITDPRARIRTDSRATIRFTGLMGQNYVAIDFGPGKGPEVDPVRGQLLPDLLNALGRQVLALAVPERPIVGLPIHEKLHEIRGHASDPPPVQELSGPCPLPIPAA